MKTNFQTISLYISNRLILFIIIILQKIFSEPLITPKVSKTDDFRTEKNALQMLIKPNTK